MDQPIDWYVDIAQVPFTASGATVASVSQSLWLDSLIVPAYFGAFSAILFTIQSAKDVCRKTEDLNDGTEERKSWLRCKLDIVGGPSIYAFRVVQVAVVLALFAISGVQLVLSLTDGDTATTIDASHLVQIVQLGLLAYLSALGLLSLFGGAGVSFRAYAHNSWVLACLWAAYMYRDVWPYATVTLSPADAAEGPLVWVKLALLSIAAVVIPLTTPRKYEPINPKKNEEASPEQITPAWSLLTYSFLSPLVWLAYRMPHLPLSMLPPMSDFDFLRNLTGAAFPVLDPQLNKSRHALALKLIRVFWIDLCHLSAMSFAAVLAAFAAPISIINLLNYLETGSLGKFGIKPWFWIALFFFGRVFRSLSDEWFMYQTTRVNVRMHAIITQLVFEHSLRIRMKADVSDNVITNNVAAATPAVTPEDVSIADFEGTSTSTDSDVETDVDATVHSTESSTAAAVKTNKDDKRKENTTEAASPLSEAVRKAGAGKNLIGRMNNIVTSDVYSLEWCSMRLVFATIESPLQIMLCMVFLHQILGWSAWVGFATMIASLPVPGLITKYIRNLQREKMKRTDARMQLVTEMMNVIRMIKLFGWEPRIAARLGEKRVEELRTVRKFRILAMSNMLCNQFIPIIIMISTFFTYTVVMKQTLTASKVFSAMSVFDMLRMDIQETFYVIPALTQGYVALERIGDFLYNTELIDEFTESSPEAVALPRTPAPEEHKNTIGIRHASFTWAADSATSANVTPGGTRQRAFVLSVDNEVYFQRGKINLIVGPTGAGKTSLLMALLGEMHCLPHSSDSFVNLPRENGVAYTAQESWVQNDTIRNNILFDAPFDEVRYNKVIDQCALRRDLSLFDAGDQTEVGEKGITLSGGQKARITLARAVYSSAEIVLMDDILAALDVHTSRWIVDKCLKGDLLAGRTIILVTHNVAMVSPIADFVVDMGSDGRIVSQGTLSNALAHDAKLLEDIRHEQEEIEKAKEELEQKAPENENAKKDIGKLVVEEETEHGNVGWDSMWLFIGNVGKRPSLFWMIYIGVFVIRHIIANIQTWWLGYWAAQYETQPASGVDVAYYLTIYALLVLAGTSLAAFCIVYFLFGSLRAGKIIHEKLVVSIMRTTLRWLDKTPTSRIIARCTDDMRELDGGVAVTTDHLVQISVSMMLKILAVVSFSPIFMIPSILVAFGGYICASVFMKAQLSVKREMSKASAPVLAHFGAAIRGITSIRAYGKQETFIKESLRRNDNYSRVSLVNYNLNRWVTIRVDFFGTLYASGLAIYLTYLAHMSASNAGFSLNMATAFSGMILQFVRIFNEWQVSGNSVERIQQYLVIEHEPEPTLDGVPPAYWPASGSLTVEKLSARYSATGPEVLHDISFQINAGERVGIVGRTGSGKSSLTLALLRCILTEGKVTYDGLDISKLNLDALRSNITIIPQVPELMSGTLRQNLDPFSEHDDATLNNALRSAGLFNLQNETDQSRITLDSEISGSGANLSVGQRQILALARAIVRRSKLLILDEATSAIDYETDTIIQTSLRNELDKDVTLLTVAHRLQTIMDSDKIMVLDAGKIVEFGKPSELLNDENGMLRALVDESGDKEKLYAMAEAIMSS